METAAGKRGARRGGMETASGRRDRRSVLDIKSLIGKAVEELYPFPAALRRMILSLEKGELDPSVQHYIKRELRATEGILKRWMDELVVVHKTMAEAEEQGRILERTDTQVMLSYSEFVFDPLFRNLMLIQGILNSTSVLDSNPRISELIKKTVDNLARIKLEFTMETAEGSQGELISSSVASEMGEEGTTSTETAEVEIEKANEMGEESATCIEAAELEIEVVKGMMEEKMQTNQFFDISCHIFLSKLYDLFRRPCEDTTSLSSMHFTHTTPPGDAASVASTLQIFSVKLEEISEEALESNWPLCVYGTVAARDTVDHNRNILFHRARGNCQILTKKDPCLELTGPSRAIVAIDPVDFEIELKVKGSRKKASEDRVLMRQTFVYSGDETTLLNNNHCKIMLRCAKLENTVQATIVAVRVINWRKRAWPFKHGGKVSCIAKGPVVKPEDEEEVVLQHHLVASNNSHDGYLHLSRRVVSVELNGQLRVTIHSSKFRGHVFFLPQECKSSTRKCHLGPYELEVTVAWSLLIQDKRCFIPREECVDGGQAFKHTAKEIRRGKTTLETQSAMEIYSLLDLISKNATKLKTEPKLRISDYSISEIKIHMDYMYRDVTSLLQMMEKVDNSRCQEPFMEKMDGKTRMEDKGKSATEMQSPKTYYKYGSNAIFNGLDQLCSQLDQMGLLSYKGKSQLLFKDNTTKIKSDEIEPPIISVETVEAAKGKDEVSPRISSSTNIKLEIQEVKKMNAYKTEEECFDKYRQSWVYNWSIFCGTFTETTSVSSMQFTYSTPGQSPSAALVDSTLQIYSIKVAEIERNSGLSWPLRVYGVVAARDTVDRNRNILFSRQRDNCQILTPKDPFLRLTGPSRAIVTREPAHVEIELKVKGAKKV